MWAARKVDTGVPSTVNWQGFLVVRLRDGAWHWRWHCNCVVQTMLFVICGTTYAMPQISFGGFGWAYCCDFSLVWDMPISGGRLRSDWTGLDWWRALSLWPLGRLHQGASCLPPCRDEAAGGPGPALCLAQNTWLGERSLLIIPCPFPAVGRSTYFPVCCLARRAFQIYGSPRARNAKRIPWKLPGACMKPLWHAWTWASGLWRVLAGRALAEWALRRRDHFRRRSSALNKAVSYYMHTISKGWGPRWDMPDRYYRPAGTQAPRQASNDRAGGRHKLSPLLALAA